MSMITRQQSAASQAPGDVAFVNPENALTNLATYASAAIAAATTPVSEQLELTNPLRKPPPTARITGVIINATMSLNTSDLAAVVTETIQLVHAGANIGTNQAGPDSISKAKAAYRWGGQGNTMGATLTAAMARASTFGVAIAGRANTFSASFRVYTADIDVKFCPERRARQREFSRTRGR